MGYWDGSPPGVHKKEDRRFFLDPFDVPQALQVSGARDVFDSFNSFDVFDTFDRYSQTLVPYSFGAHVCGSDRRISSTRVHISTPRGSQ
jgi:hypothetical protein